MMRKFVGDLGVGIASGIIVSALLLFFTGPALEPYGWSVIGIVFVVSSLLSMKFCSGPFRRASTRILSGVRSGDSLEVNRADINARGEDVSILSDVKVKGKMAIADAKIEVGGPAQDEKQPHKN